MLTYRLDLGGFQDHGELGTLRSSLGFEPTSFACGAGQPLLVTQRATS